MNLNPVTHDQSFKVLIWRPDGIPSSGLEQQLHRAGHCPVCCSAPDNLLDTVLKRLPDSIMVLHNPADTGTLRLAGQLRTTRDCPLILAAGNWNGTLAKAAAVAGYDAFLSIPATPDTVHVSLLQAEAGHMRIARLREQTTELEQHLAERKLIERAKGLLMTRKHLNEEQAFRTMRSEAMRRRISLARLASEILDTGAAGTVL